MKRLIAFFKIIRPVNIAITFAAVIIGGFFCSDFFIFNDKIIFAALSATLIAAAGNIINDYYDLEIDRINRPDRVLPQGIFSPKFSLHLYFDLTALGLLLAFQVSVEVVLIAFIAVVLLFLYSAYFKRKPLVGNAVVGMMTGLAFVYGGIAVGNWKAAIIPAVFAFMVNVIREIFKDIEDIPGDEKAGIKTFPIARGKQSAVTVIRFLLLLLIAATFVPFLFHLYRIEYFVIVMMTVNPIFIYAFKNSSDPGKLNISKLNALLKVSMILGLTAIFFGK